MIPNSSCNAGVPAGIRRGPTARHTRHTAALRFTALAVLMFILAGAPAGGASYQVDWYAISGGGCMWSTGAGYRLGGTAGQPAAAPLSGGPYVLTDGFWALPATVPGDVNGDDHVDAADLLILADSFGLKPGDPGYDMRCDSNADGCVDVTDLLILARCWGT